MLNTEHLLDADYIQTGKVKYVVHPYYLGRPEIGLATEAAWCAADQDRFFDYQHALYEDFGNVPTQQMLAAIANQLELDTNDFTQCLSNRTHRDDVEAARRSANRRGVDSTPTFFINDRRIEGNQPYDEFRAIIDEALEPHQ